EIISDNIRTDNINSHRHCHKNYLVEAYVTENLKTTEIRKTNSVI
ncbi:4391_t:CDS:1, partial [Dentiscutata heterogama]